MNGIFFYIGLGAGLAAACGLRPFLPVLLAGALAGADALGVHFTHDPFRFLEADWWLLVVVAALAFAYVLQLVLGLSPTIDPGDRTRRSDPLGASLAGLAFGAGALLFGGTLAAHGDSAWPGIFGGLAIVGLAQRAADPVPRRGLSAARGARRAAAPARLHSRRAARLVHLARARARR
jgi:hypothetical protein